MPSLRSLLLASAALVVSFVAVLLTEVMAARGGVHPGAGPPPASGAPAGPPGAPVDTVVWLGDSTGAGIGATGPPGTLPEQAAAAIGRPVSMTVLARSGDRVADVLHHQLPALAPIRPTVVFITVGANDTTHLTSRGAFRRDYERVLAGLPSTVRRTVILGVPDMGSPPRLAQPLRAVAGWRGRSLDTDVRRLAALTPRAVYVDIAGKTGPAFRAHPATYFAPDRFHPNDAGYGLWARAVAEECGNNRCGGLLKGETHERRIERDGGPRHRGKQRHR
jgi:lysophospholipase L1-like esterase